jgi:hypothetical protein
VGLETLKEGAAGTNAYEAALSISSDFLGLRGLDRTPVHDLEVTVLVKMYKKRFSGYKAIGYESRDSLNQGIN